MTEILAITDMPTWSRQFIKDSIESKRLLGSLLPFDAGQIQSSPGG
jgi:hypothetical protein